MSYSGGGVTDGHQDTWSEGSHEKPLTLEGSGGKTDKTYTQTHTQVLCGESLIGSGMEEVFTQRNTMLEWGGGLPALSENGGECEVSNTRSVPHFKKLCAYRNLPPVLCAKESVLLLS